MTTTNQHVSASQHHAPDDSEKEQARFLTTEDAARLCASSKKSPMHHRQQQEKQHQQGSSYSAPQFPCLSLLSLDASSLLQESLDTISSHLLTNHADEQQQVNLLARPLIRRNSYHSSLVGSSRHHDIASIQQVADRDTFLLQNNAVVAAHQQQAAYNAAIVEELEIITRATSAERMRRTRLLLSERNAGDQLLQLHANSQLHYRRY
jgi:hypothetical protein